MVESPGIDLKITNIHKYFLYIGAVILILSLFFDIKVIEASVVRSFSVWILIAGSWTWFFDKLIEDLYQYEKKFPNLPDNRTARQKNNFKNYVTGKHILKFVFLIVTSILLSTIL